MGARGLCSPAKWRHRLGRRTVGGSMHVNLSRRRLLAGAGCAVAGTAAGQMLMAVAQAQESAPAQASSGLCMTMVFLNAAKAKFDQDKYIKKHLPLLRESYGDSVERIELRTSSGSAMGVPSAVMATSTLWIRDVQGFS